jgi:hypothetical protein
MLHFAATIRCPYCDRAFSMRLTADDKAEADAMLSEPQVRVATCPNHGGPFRVCLPQSAFRRVEPEPVAPPVVLDGPPAKRWWQFWK